MLQRNAFILVSILLFSCLFSTLAWSAERPAVSSIIEQKKETGITLLKQGQFEEAYDLFMSLLRERPNDPEINAGVAEAAYGLKKYTNALLAYERIVDINPLDVQNRLRLARIYILLGDAESARQELAQLQKYDSSITEQDIADVVSALEQQHSPWQVHGKLSLGLMYDSNANQGPRSDILNLGIFQDLYIEGVKERSSVANYASAMLDVGYRLSEDSPWWIVGDLALYQRYNFASDLTNNNSFYWGRAALGIRHVGSSTLLDIRAKVDMGYQQHDEGENQTTTNPGAEISLLIGASNYLQFISRTGVDYHYYDVENGREGFYWYAGEYIRLLMGESNHEAILGVMVMGENAEFKDYKYRGWELSFRLVFNLPHKVDISPFITYNEKHYDGPATILEFENRRDRELRYGIGLNWEFAENFTFETSVQYSENKSNSGLYKYDQFLTTAGISWKF